jgi:hypothetical protein
MKQTNKQTKNHYIDCIYWIYGQTASVYLRRK